MEVLIKTKACGICGTDLLEWYRIKNVPDETTGKIVIESRSPNYKPGQRILTLIFSNKWK